LQLNLQALDKVFSVFSFVIVQGITFWHASCTKERWDYFLGTAPLIPGIFGGITVIIRGLKSVKKEYQSWV
jgi:hypothetical protein